MEANDKAMCSAHGSLHKMFRHVTGAQKIIGSPIEILMNPAERKARIEAILKSKAIPFLESLPCIESEEETELRTPQEIGMRMVCLFCVIGSAFSPTATGYKSYLKKHQLWNHLTPEETLFLQSPTPDDRTIINFTWRCEALFLLMWAVRLVEKLPWPDREIPTDEILSRFPNLDQSPWSFIFGLKLRSKEEILDASDLLYRLHWAARNAPLQGQAAPSGVKPGVILEWRHAINWITNYDDLDWDDVRTDT
jgi:hypothetical protein